MRVVDGKIVSDEPVLMTERHLPKPPDVQLVPEELEGVSEAAIDVYERFVNRDDVFAEQQTTGAYLPVARPITHEDVQAHLDGDKSYGTYVIDPADQTCKYVCFDLDINDEIALATLCGLVEAMVIRTSEGDMDSINSLLCEFSGNKGYHVWVFFDTPIRADIVRRWVSALFTDSWRETASEYGWPGELEVFPKQDEVAEGGYGNLVKLPLGIHQVSQQRSEIIGCRNWARDLLDVRGLDSQDVIAYVENLPPEEKSHRRDRREPTGDYPASPFACIDLIMHEGVGSGYRDNAMFHLALYLYGHGIEQDIAEDIALRANERFEPPLEERAVLSKVRSAYTGRYEGARCGSDWLAEICPGPCNEGWRVARTQSGGLSNAQVSSPVEVEVTSVSKTKGRTRIKVSHPDAENEATFIIGRGR